MCRCALLAAKCRCIACYECAARAPRCLVARSLPFGPCQVTQCPAAPCWAAALCCVTPPGRRAMPHVFLCAIRFHVLPQRCTTAETREVHPGSADHSAQSHRCHISSGLGPHAHACDTCPTDMLLANGCDSGAQAASAMHAGRARDALRMLCVL